MQHRDPGKSKLVLALLTMLSPVGATDVLGQCRYEWLPLPEHECQFIGTGGVRIRDVDRTLTVAGERRYCPLDEPSVPETWAWIWEYGDPEITHLELLWDYHTAETVALNDVGQAVGWISGGAPPGLGKLAWIREPDGPVVLLGHPEWGNWSEPRAINDHGIVVGAGGDNLEGPGQVALLWQDGRVIDFADEIPGPSAAFNAINNRGVIVGRRKHAAQGERLGFRWSEGVLTELGPAPGAASSEPRAINDRGDIAGDGRRWEEPEPGLAGGGAWFRTGFVHRDGVMIDVGFLPGFKATYVNDISPLGVAVGRCEDHLGTDDAGFLWHAGSIHALVDLIDDPPLDPDFEVEYAAAVNHDGVIAVHGAGVPGQHFLLVPVDPPPADISGDCRVDGYDLLLMLRLWGTDDAYADSDGDGVVEFPDLLRLLAGWTG